MNQHFVPRAYLKNFSNKRNKDYFINVFDKLSGRQFETNIKRICSEIDLYTLEEGNSIANDLFAVEKVYANGIEPLYVKSYGLLTDHNISYITDLQRLELLVSIFQFHFRNPKVLNRALSHHKREIKLLCNRAKQKDLKGITYMDEDFSFREYSESDIVDLFEKKVIKEYKEKHLAGLQEIGTFHEFAKFEICIIKDDSEFFTSDNPLTFQDRIAENENLFLKSKEFTISLNRKVALKIFHDNRRDANRIYRCWIPNGSVALINQEIYKQSSRFVFTTANRLKEHSNTSSLFENDSIEAKMDVIHQILKVTSENEHPEIREVYQYYLNIYEKKGGLTAKEEYEMHQKLHIQRVTFINKITR